MLLGTVYVLNEQAIQELVLLYAGPSHARYRRLLFVQQLCFQSGCSLNAALAYGLYAAGGFEWSGQLTTAEVYDARADRWRPLPDLVDGGAVIEFCAGAAVWA